MSLQSDVVKIISANMSLQGISGAEMARRLGTSPSQVYRVLDGENTQMETLEKMLGVLGVGLIVSDGKEAA